MHRAPPVSSKVCSDKWQERSYRIHRQKLQKIRPSIDNQAPQMYPHLYQKLKKAQMEEERCSEIERDNRTLVRRMTEIMQRSAIDTRNQVEYKSLNKDARRRELVRITQENQALLRRIQGRQPTYSHLEWEQDRERNEHLCERICRYPYRPAKIPNSDMYQYYDEQGMPVGSPMQMDAYGNPQAPPSGYDQGSTAPPAAPQEGGAPSGYSAASQGEGSGGDVSP
eukprot:NODE_5548_length_934_cov_101.918619_g5325_i0.p1 GENE.NODE_5548_length_934_cov_101.918619_g5325_i0~~NODE_5548_length_934_cov_101.918619_g5325_i0.p1  ORF type:complete len:251 (+),score=63.17 NODE_5548_length_934_cov_101.918619_g5325_i0:82-753(+)